MESFEDDRNALDEFHQRAYDGAAISDAERAAAKEVWWRVVEAPEARGDIEAIVLLLYTAKHVQDA